MRNAFKAWISLRRLVPIAAQYERYLQYAAPRAPAATIGGRRLINCQQLVDFCIDFLDGSLPDEERRMFQDHLGHCGKCVTFFRTYERTPAVSREAFALQMPSSVKETVRSYLRARYERRSR